MPILIRETNIRANLSEETTGTTNSGQAQPPVASEQIADLEGQIQKLLLRKLKARDER